MVDNPFHLWRLQPPYVLLRFVRLLDELLKACDCFGPFLTPDDSERSPITSPAPFID